MFLLAFLHLTMKEKEAVWFWMWAIFIYLGIGLFLTFNWLMKYAQGQVWYNFGSAGGWQNIFTWPFNYSTLTE